MVYDVRLGNGSLAIAKVLKHKVLKDSLRGADFIEWRAGVGCVKLLDRSDDILLMEHAGNETLRDVLFATATMMPRPQSPPMFSFTITSLQRRRHQQAC